MKWRYNHLTAEFVGERDNAVCEITLQVKIHKRQLPFLLENEADVMQKYSHQRASLVRNIHAATGTNAQFTSKISLEDPSRGQTMGALRVVVRLPYPYPSVIRALIEWRTNFLAYAKLSGYNDNGTRRRATPRKENVRESDISL